MVRHVLPALFALFVWWSSTVAIMFLYRRPHTFRWSFPLATAGMLLALFGLWATRDDTSVAGAYLAFICGVTVCGWHLLSFYTGVLTGPKLSEAYAKWPRLLQAIYACLYHELLGIGFALGVAALVWHGTNVVGLGALLILWVMHQSARLNVFLGVRNFDARMLPGHLDWVHRLISKRRSNLLFPFSIILTCALTAVLGLRAISPAATTAQAVGMTFLCLLMALALFEHALLMLPEIRSAPARNPQPASSPTSNAD